MLAGIRWSSAECVLRRTRSSACKRLLIYALLVLFALIYIYPFIVQLSTSFKTNADAVANPLSLVPDPATTSAYGRIADTDFPLWFRNSFVVAVLVTLGRVFFDSLAGYALARLRFRGRGLVFNAVIAVMAVPGIVLLIPKFLVLNYLGIYNTFPALFLPLIADAAGVFIMKQFFESIPVSVEEAARIDGAGPFRTYWSIVLPMARPALITLTILSFQASWNELRALHHRLQRPGPLHAHPGRRAADLGRPGVGGAVPHLDDGGAADDHPDGAGVHLVPAVLHRWGQCWCGEGLNRALTG